MQDVLHGGAALRAQMDEVERETRRSSPPPGEPRFDVVLVSYGTRDPEIAAAALADAFELAMPAARQIVRCVPVTVKRDVEPEVAAQFREVLRRTGAHVEVRPASPSTRPPSFTPRGTALFRTPSAPPPASVRPPSVAPPASAVVQTRAGAMTVNVPRDDEPETEKPQRNFWLSIPFAFVHPFRGPGWKWLVWGTGYGAVYMIAMHFLKYAPIGSLFFALFFGGGLVGLAAAFYRACLWGAAANEDEPNGLGEVDASKLYDEFVVPGFFLTVFVLLIQVLPMIWIMRSVAHEGPAGLISPLAWLMILAPSLYWPIGVGMTSLRGSFVHFWNVGLALKIIVFAPLHCLAIVGIGAVAAVAAWLGAVITSVAAGPAHDLSLTPLLIGFPLLYVHGAQGALFGHLARTRPEIFAD